MNELTLNNGVRIPQIGLGTAAIGQWQQDDEYVKDVILKAIKAGYRHIDTASLYGNERSVGRAIKESGIARGEFFVTSKVWDTDQGRETTIAAFEKTLERLAMDYLDLYLIHWPIPEKTQETWQAMESLYEQNRTRALGLSNFRQSDIEQVLGFAKVKPAYNQIELHPYLVQKELTEYCENQGIAVACWSPLGSGTWTGVPVDEKPVSDQTISEIAEKYQVSNAQVILKWNVQQNRIVIPKAESPKNMRNNLLLDNFELSAGDITKINGLNRNHRFGPDPDTAHEANSQLIAPA